MNPHDDLKDEIATLQCVYSDEELTIDFRSHVVRIVYTATLDKDTKLDIAFTISTSVVISVTNHRDTKKTIPSDILSSIQAILTKKYESEERDSMPIFQCLSFCTDELLTDPRLNLTQRLQKIPLNDDIDPDKIFWSEVAKYRKAFKANGGSFIKYTKLDLTHAALAKNDLTIPQEVYDMLTADNYVNRALWKAIPSVKDLTIWSQKEYNATHISIRFIATPSNMDRFLKSRNKRSIKMEVVFHGTDSCNDRNIIDRGLVVGGTKGVPITNGRAYGKGVYCSPKMDVANGYGRSIFVCLVRKSQCNKSGQIYVVPNDDDILPIYLLRHW